MFKQKLKKSLQARKPGSKSSTYLSINTFYTVVWKPGYLIFSQTDNNYGFHERLYMYLGKIWRISITILL